MNSEKIRIEEIKLKDLDVFVRTFVDQSSPGEVIPISQQRIIAHSQNPYAKAEDIVLLVAVRAGKCIGYHRLLPGLLKHDDNLSRIFWATTFYVSKAFRGQGIGKLLIEKIKDLNIDFIVTGMTPAAEKTYLGCGLKALGPMVYYQLRIDKVLRFKFFYHRVKHLLYHHWLNSQSEAFQKFGHMRIKQINTEFKNLSADADDAPIFYRGIELINWMLNYPWVLSKKDAFKRQDKYHFASARNLFDYIVLEIFSRKDNGIKGYLVLSVSDKNKKTIVKVLDYYLKDLDDLNIIGCLSLEFAAHYSADRIDIPPELRTYFSNLLFQRYFLKRKKRSYVYHSGTPASPLACCADCISLNYCDGDTAFT